MKEFKGLVGESLILDTFLFLYRCIFGLYSIFSGYCREFNILKYIYCFKNPGTISEAISYIEVISKIEKWFEVKPPARWAYAPEGTVQGSEESRPQVGDSSKPSVRTAGIGPFGLFEMTSRG